MFSETVASKGAAADGEGDAKMEEEAKSK